MMARREIGGKEKIIFKRYSQDNSSAGSGDSETVSLAAETYYMNKVALMMIKEKFTPSYLSTKSRYLIMELYSIFENMHQIFTHLNLDHLYEQLR